MPQCPCKYRKTDEPRDALGHAPFCGLYNAKAERMPIVPPSVVINADEPPGLIIYTSAVSNGTR